MQQPPDPYPQYPQQQWQQPSQPLPPQQPMYQHPQYSQQQAPPMQPGPQPPKKPSRPRFLLVLGAIILVLVAIGSGLAALGGNHKTTTTAGQPTPAATLTASANAIATGIASLNADLTAQAMTPTTPPVTPTPASTGIGATQSSGSWDITINSVSTSQGDQYDTPKAGDTYLLINFTGKNTGSSNLEMSPIYFTLRDEQGNTYNIAYITVPHDPRGTVVAGQQIRGDLSYEIPQSIHQYILQFDSPTDFDNSQVVQWYLKV